MQFRPKKIENGEYSLSGNTLEVLYLIHKKKSLEDIKKETLLNNEELKSSLKSLIENDLIIQDSGNNNFLGEDFSKALQLNLAKTIGPVATLLIEDAFAEMGVNESKIPKNQAAAIIRMLSTEIKDESMRHNFMKKMTDYLK